MQAGAYATETTDRDVIQRAELFDMSKVVGRYCSDNGVDRVEGERRARELVRFLAICATAREPIGMAGPIDELWHTFLMFTREYSAFCASVAGRFIHHIPSDEDDAMFGVVPHPYERFLTRYNTAFGEPPSDLWPSAAAGCRSCANGCSKCNAW